MNIYTNELIEKFVGLSKSRESKSIELDFCEIRQIRTALKMYKAFEDVLDEALGFGEYGRE